MTDVIVLQHLGCEPLGTIRDSLSIHGFSPRYVRLFAGDPVPKGLEDAAGLIVMGGPMSVYERDRYPFLGAELKLMEVCLSEGRPLLGVCLGSQLLATVLGGRVRKGQRKEIGWHPLRLTEAGMIDPLWRGAPREFSAFHWHGDVFDPPAGTTSLASSALTACQGFRYRDNVYGLLFHLEVTKEVIRGMATAFEGELSEVDLDAAQVLAEGSTYLPSLEVMGGLVFDRWASHLSL
jgi:GMP synthase (glutamine-hydrolysing)